MQPAMYMQPLLGSLKLVSEKGIFVQKFFTTKQTRMCMVDLRDIAEAVSIILTKPGHDGATYELCGPENLSLDDMLAALNKSFGREIKAKLLQISLLLHN